MAPTAEIAPLTENTTAYLQPPGGWFLNNAGWITGDKGTVLVDTCATEGRSRKLLDAVRTATGSGPLWTVLTHAHGDHTHGAGLLSREGATILASSSAANDIAAGPHTYPAMFSCDHWGEIDPPEQIETVDRTATFIDLGSRTVEIHPVPSTAHTDGDLVVFCPQEGVLFTGDLVFDGVTPLALHGDPRGWLEALDWLESFDARYLVPGHGPIRTDDTGLRAMREYLRWVCDSAADHTEIDAIAEQGRKRWPQWADSERHVVNLHVAHAQIHGYPFDAEATLGKLLRLTNGPIPLALQV